MSWTPRELRHSFVSLLSSSGMPIEDIAHLVGHVNTRVTELVYRKELRPVLTRGAVAMDVLFPDDATSRASVSAQETAPRPNLPSSYRNPMVLAPLNMINILFRSGGSAPLAIAPVGGIGVQARPSS